MIALKTFAPRVYSSPGVSDACLGLQDELAVDVPLLLYCGWYGVYAGALPDAVFVCAQQLSQHMGHHLIQPLRQIRRWMKQEPGDERWLQLRENIKAQELQAELLLLERLQEAYSPTGNAGFVADLPVVLNNLQRCVDGATSMPSHSHARLLLISEACLQHY